MRTFKVPIKVTMVGWVPIKAMGMNDATLIAEHMKGHTVIRPNWDTLLKDRQESYVVETSKIEEMVHEAQLETA
mgnify:CR=1 FL=1